MIRANATLALCVYTEKSFPHLNYMLLHLFTKTTSPVHGSVVFPQTKIYQLNNIIPAVVFLTPVVKSLLLISLMSLLIFLSRSLL